MRAGFILTAFALAGCASLGEGWFGEDCASIDWRAAGFNDGSAGAGAPHALYTEKACAPKQAAGASYALYLSGWEKGVETYCSPANGFTRGASGEEFNGVCNGEGSAAFADAFREGEALFFKETEAELAGNAYSDAMRELWDVKHRLAMVEIAMRSAGYADRRKLLLESKALKTDLDAVEKSLADLAEQKKRAEAEASSMRAAIAARDDKRALVQPARVSY
ncbi:MAG: DUF2799 domain-containing protein [Amphiplicatus sp.]